MQGQGQEREQEHDGDHGKDRDKDREQWNGQEQIAQENFALCFDNGRWLIKG
jgi:hypothetical protein